MKVTVWQDIIANARTQAPGRGKITFVFEKRAAIIVVSVTLTN